MKASSALFMLLIGSSQLAACEKHPLLGQWAFSELEQAWEVQNEGKLIVSNAYDDVACTEGGQSSSVQACHQQRRWANAGSIALNDADHDAYQFVVWKVTADTLNGRLDTCRCRDKPEIYYGVIEDSDLVLFGEDKKTLVDRGKFKSAPD